MSPVRSATSSARPDDLHRYRADVVRRHALTVRALRDVEQALAAYDLACPEVPINPPPLGVGHDLVARLRGLAIRVGDVGDAFLQADRSPAGGLAHVADDRFARLIVERHPGLANATVLGPLAEDLAAEVAAGLAEAALDGRRDLAELRATIPAALAEDPAFARSVLRRLDPDHLAIVVDRMASDATAGRPTADLRWLGDLFARGASRSPHGPPTDETLALLDRPDGRTAVRILRASSGVALPAATIEVVALSAAILHPSRSDGGHPFLVDRRSLDTGDDRILLEAAGVPGLALRLLTGDDHQHPIRGRVERLVGSSSQGSARGLAALLDAARVDPHRDARHGGRSAAGLELVHGVVAGLAGLPAAGLATDAPRASLVVSATAVIADDLDLAVAHTRSPDDAEERRERVESLTHALEHAAEHEETWTPLVDDLHTRRVEGLRISIETGDDAPLERAARSEAILAAAAERADAPDRRLDPVIGRVADAAGAFAERSYGPFGGPVASTGIRVAADRVADALAGDPGSAAERLRARRLGTDRVLAVIEHLPGMVVWVGSGVSDRAGLRAAAEDPGGDRVLEQWELVQRPEVQRELARLRSVYAAGSDLSS